jgi:hypothetical protein
LDRTVITVEGVESVALLVDAPKQLWVHDRETRLRDMMKASSMTTSMYIEWLGSWKRPQRLVKPLE